MKGLAELVVSLCDLCEAEGRLLEAGILRTVRRAGLLSLGLLFGAAALALLLGALYALLTSLLPTPAALALLGGASAAVAVVLLWNARGAAARDARAQKPEQGAKVAHAAQADSGETPPAMGPTAPAQAAGPGRGIWAQASPYGRAGRAPGLGKPGPVPAPDGRLGGRRLPGQRDTKR